MVRAMSILTLLPKTKLPARYYPFALPFVLSLVELWLHTRVVKDYRGDGDMHRGLGMHVIYRRIRCGLTVTGLRW